MALSIKEELYALRGLNARPISEEELATTKPFFQMGTEPNKDLGILMIHGFTVTPANFYHYSRKLSELGYTVSLPLLPGHGTSPEDLKDTKWEDWLQEMEKKLSELQKKTAKQVIIGISLGGALALQLAKEYRNLKKLYLLAPAVYPPHILQIAMFTALPLMDLFNMPYWIHVAGDINKESAYEIGYKKTPIYGLRELFDCMITTQKLLPYVNTPVHIFQGKTDHEVPAFRTEGLLAQIGTSNKNKTITWLENSFHEIPRDHDSEKVLNHIIEDLETIK